MDNHQQSKPCKTNLSQLWDIMALCGSIRLDRYLLTSPQWAVDWPADSGGLGGGPVPGSCCHHRRPLSVVFVADTPASLQVRWTTYCMSTFRAYISDINMNMSYDAIELYIASTQVISTRSVLRSSYIIYDI